jgi:hypothetical protein
MTGTSTSEGEDIQSLIARLQNINVARVEGDEHVKGEALALARKIRSTLEGPINRATDLVFKVCTLQTYENISAADKNNSRVFRSRAV